MPARIDRRAAIGAAAVIVIALVAVFLATRDADRDDGPEGARDRSTSETTTVGDVADELRYPAEVEGRLGAETVLVNDDDVAHTFTSDDGHFDSGPLKPGGELAIATLPTGTYGFHCSIHPELRGTLTITE